MGWKIYIELPVYIPGMSRNIENSIDGAIEFAQLLAEHSAFKVDEIIDFMEQGDGSTDFVFILPYEMESILIDLGINKGRDGYSVR